MPIGNTEKKGLLSDFKVYLKAPFLGASLNALASPQEMKQVNCPLDFYAREIMITDFYCRLFPGNEFLEPGMVS